MQKLSAWTRASVLSFQSFGYLQCIIIAEKQNRKNELMHRNPETDAENHDICLQAFSFSRLF